MQKRWIIKPYDATTVATLQSQLKVSEALCILLVQRGITTYNEAENFFRPQLSHTHSPWLMKDMYKAVDRLIKAFTQKEKILVFGDYDVDGTTSVAMMYLYLCDVYEPCQLDYYIPHRYREGYGVSKEGIDYAKANNQTLIVALDCGIKSAELVAYATTLGIDFIICDHHLPDAIIPKAAAVLNPKQVDCNYPFKELCGCGVGYKLICAVNETLKLPANKAEQYLDLVATAIAADIVPIVDENRILAYYGLQKVNTNPNAGIAALMQLATRKEIMTINSLVFMIAPRINAAGRMDDAKKAVQLFIQKTKEAAIPYGELLHSDNTDRREADGNTTVEALHMLEQNPTNSTLHSTVVYQAHWHKGVVGIVASRLIETYYRPTVVLTNSGDYVAGSARSIPGFNLYEAIHACRQHLIGYGGHYFAAGLTMLPQHVTAFAAQFENEVVKALTPTLLIPQLLIDAQITFDQITQTLYNIQNQMEPFGPENMRPTYLTTKVYNTGYCKIVKEQHIKFSLKHGAIILNGIGFGLAAKYELLTQNEPIDVVYTLDENSYNGTTTLQLKVIDFKLSWG